MPDPSERQRDAQTAAEAAAFRRLLQHLRDHPEAQNIDLMNLAGFCRNCLSKWYRSAAEEQGLSLSDAQAREYVYGMPYEAWKQQFQQPASATQLDRFAQRPSDEAPDTQEQAPPQQ